MIAFRAMKKMGREKSFLLVVFVSIITMLFSVCANLSSSQIVLAESVSDAQTLSNMTIEQISSMKRYNSRDYGIVADPLDQGSSNICWAYATASASETSILRDRLSSAIRFSPVQIAYATRNRNPDPLGNTVGIYSGGYDGKGSPQDTFLPLSQWCAPVKENDTPYTDGYNKNAYRLLDATDLNFSYYDNEKLFEGKTQEEVKVIQATIRRNEIKKAIATYGAVTGSYFNARGVKYYNPKNETLENGVAHAITIIGWDDDIPASKFQPKGATQNGGWIIKNSYHSLPFFYISYDYNPGNVYAFKYANKEDFDYNYFYDNDKENIMQNGSVSKCVSNIFEAKKGDLSHSEYVKAVNVATVGNRVKCNVYVYTNLQDTNNPESGTLSAVGERTLEYGGYHTICLDRLAKIEKGTLFSVVVKIESTIGKDAHILFAKNGSSNTRTKSNGNWNKYNFAGRIKAYTVLQETNKTDIFTAEHSNISQQFFTGKEICPEITLSINSKILVKDVDYSLTYKNNVNAGSGEIVVSGMGEYVGSYKILFEISPIEVPQKPNSIIQISSTATTLGDIPLPDGWRWENPHLPVENLTTANAVYVGENKDNYTGTTLAISLQPKEDNSGGNEGSGGDSGSGGGEGSGSDSGSDSENNIPATTNTLSSGQIATVVVCSTFVTVIGAFAIYHFAIKKKTFADLVHGIKSIFKKKK